MSNVMTMADMEAVADQLGAEHGKGKDTQVKFLLKMIEGGYHNVLDVTNKNKHGTGIDDAEYFAERYVKAQRSAVVFDAKADNQQKLMSCLRTGIKLGAWPKGGNGEPLATVNNLMNMRQNLKKVPGEAKKLDDAANTLLRYARQQIRQDTLIDEDQLESFCMRKQADLLTAEDHIERIRRSLRGLYDGKASNNTACDNSKHVKDAISSLTKRLEEIAQNRRGVRPKAAFAVIDDTQATTTA